MQNLANQKGRDLGILTIDVPYRAPGNMVKHVAVAFRIIKRAATFEAFPMPDARIGRLINLPEELRFQVINGWVTCDTPRYNYVALDLFEKMKKQGVDLS